MSTLKEQFDQVSKKYDVQRPMLIPCFEDFYTICLPVIKRHPLSRKVLDIGAGTGLFTQFIYQERPDLHFTLVDISGDMLAVARERFAGASNVSYQTMDFSSEPITEKYDLIISALAIHHLEDDQKDELYQNIFDALNPGGLFINADQVKGRSSWFDNYYKTHWQETIASSGLEQTAVANALERIKLDKFGHLEYQLLSLEKAGFQEVDCIYKHNNFVVFAGIKN
jgi:tRNA (cmo5U34)-methyltransferase